MRRILVSLFCLGLAASPLAAQDGVVNPQTNASALTSGTVAAARGGAGTINGALAGNGSGTVSQAACANLSNGGGFCSVTPSQITNALGSDVNLNSTGTFFDGPSIAQGSTGTWFASGQVTVTDSVLASIICKLWDGTTTISSGGVIIAANTNAVISLSGYLASPAANIRISCRDASNTTGKITFTGGGVGANAASISAFRIQ